MRAWLVIPIGAAVLAAQAPQRPGMIQGQVIARKTGEPIVGARISPFKFDSTVAELPVAVTDSGWRDEVWLTALAGLSTRVTVAEGAVRNLGLTLRTPPPR